MSTLQEPVLNVAAYRFVALDDPGAWVDAIRGKAEALELKGTVIVASEGINLFVAGIDDRVETFLAWLGEDPRFIDAEGRPAWAALTVKRSRSATQPFGRLRVRHKPEIVTMRRPAIRPQSGRAPAVTPERLAAWLAQGHDDDGRALALLDTRNAFEVEAGSFVGARHLDIERFDAFPDAIDRHRGAFDDRTIVTFCTGGIRCEKAALYMRASGFEHVVQLDGGILGYFDKVGDAHWRGDCFVFDERVALDPALKTRAGQA